MQKNPHVILTDANMVENVMRQKMVVLYVIVLEHFIKEKYVII